MRLLALAERQGMKSDDPSTVDDFGPPTLLLYE
jgi:hypothetical protein